MAGSQCLQLPMEADLTPFVQAYRAQGGRPTIYNEMTVAEMLDRLAGGETMTSITDDKHMPSYPTVCDWQRGRPWFSQAVADARKMQATSFVEQGLQILDNAETTSMAHVQKADKQAQFRHKLAQAFDRDTYGDKVQNDVNVRGVVIHTENTGLASLMSSD
jgi:hypothetical protein